LNKQLESRGSRGLIPLDSQSSARVHNQALERAAAFLERTAAGFDEAARDWVERQLSSRNQQSRDFAIQQTMLNRSKAELLRGQAAHIREMKVSE
jgi:hypothetical protein